MAPQGRSPPNPVGQQERIVDTFFVVLAFIFIAMRMWSRRLKNNRVDLSDVFVIAAWLLTVADLVTVYIAVHWGAGLYMADLYKYNPTGMEDIGKMTYYTYYTWTAEVMLIKLSILLLYRRVFYVMPTFIHIVHATMVFIVVVFISFVIGLLLQCKPIAFNWTYVPGGHCGLPITKSLILSGSVNLALDIWLVLLPIVPLWKLQHISKLKRFGLSAMFSLGILICILVGLRFKIIADTDVAEYNHDRSAASIIVAMEAYLGIISACLPTITPALRNLRSRAQQSYLSRIVTNLRTRVRMSTGSKSRSGDSHSHPKTSGDTSEASSGPGKRINTYSHKLTLGLGTTMTLSELDPEAGLGRGYGAPIAEQSEFDEGDIPLEKLPVVSAHAI